jgi:Zn-dependent peptidase ImmA (M78 family)
LLKDIVVSTGLDQNVCAELLGINPRLFNEWLVGQKPIPSFILPELSTVFGVSEGELVSRKTTPADAPAVWYKLREEDITEHDREYVLLIRKLGFFLNQVQVVTRSENLLWKALFEQIRTRIDKQTSPSEQGRFAARLFASMRNLTHGARGIGRPFRDNLRLTGLLVIETPAPKSKIEGCSFYVGNSGSEVPCLFANTYGSDWFRRNVVIAHELGHAIFDLDSQTASVDYRGEEEYRELQERRAQTFAQELFAPVEVLRHVQNTSGFTWDDLRPRDLALIVAHTDVSATTALSSAFQAGLITADQMQKYRQFSISDELKQLTPHALSTREFLEQAIREQSIWPANKRTTNLTSRRLRLPVSYINKVLSAAKTQEISLGKAAEMLMMDPKTVLERFSDYLGVTA